MAHALKKMANGKAHDSNDICIELLKWAPTETHAYLVDILNFAFTHGFPNDWQENWIKAIYKGGDCHLLNNYHTIMVGSTMAKLFSTLLETTLSVWAEKTHKRAKEQAGFRALHNTIDHLVTLQVLMDESRRMGKPLYCCFVDFKKAFDTVPRDGLWE